jgi:hypothetical protein
MDMETGSGTGTGTGAGTAVVAVDLTAPIVAAHAGQPRAATAAGGGEGWVDFTRAPTSPGRTAVVAHHRPSSTAGAPSSTIDRYSPGAAISLDTYEVSQKKTWFCGRGKVAPALLTANRRLHDVLSDRDTLLAQLNRLCAGRRPAAPLEQSASTAPSATLRATTAANATPHREDGGSAGGESTPDHVSDSEKTSRGSEADALDDEIVPVDALRKRWAEMEDQMRTLRGGLISKRDSLTLEVEEHSAWCDELVENVTILTEQLDQRDVDLRRAFAETKQVSGWDV